MEPQSEPAEWVRESRVGRLATADRHGRPHCVPVCFAWLAGAFLIALDEKPKRVDVLQLRRVRNIVENPQVCLLVDHYEENWAALRFAMVRARAELIELSEAELHVLHLKYPQYQTMQLTWGLRIRPEKIVCWSAF